MGAVQQTAREANSLGSIEFNRPPEGAAATSMYGHSAANGQCRLHRIGHSGYDSPQRRVNNRHARAPSQHVVKFDHIFGPHPHATVTNRQTDIPFLRRAVNVDVATKCVRILPFEPAQPDDSRYDGIASGRVDANDLTGPSTIFKNSPGRQAVTDFLRDLEFT